MKDIELSLPDEVADMIEAHASRVGVDESTAAALLIRQANHCIQSSILSVDRMLSTGQP